MWEPSVRNQAIVLVEPPFGRHEPGRCWWCGEDLTDPETAIKRGRSHCYPDREGRDCVKARRDSRVWSARDALIGLARINGHPLACVDCGLVVREAGPDDLHPWEADHAIPLADGGAHAVENFRCRCTDCHGVKTAREATERAAARRTAPSLNTENR